ncbi:LysR family transcriptional regulator [Pseudonocardia sp. MCCB 268]|nr:LysR family transcriptional regulator [Pseudonocardia cytotoxica]
MGTRRRCDLGGARARDFRARAEADAHSAAGRVNRELHQLRYFVTIAHEGSFTGAAAPVPVPAVAVGADPQAEQDVGARLFERTGGRSCDCGGGRAARARGGRARRTRTRPGTGGRGQRSARGRGTGGRVAQHRRLMLPVVPGRVPARAPLVRAGPHRRIVETTSPGSSSSSCAPVNWIWR